MTCEFPGVGLVSIHVSRSSQNQARERKLSSTQTIDEENVVSQEILFQQLMSIAASNPSLSATPPIHCSSEMTIMASAPPV
ncbi:MAG: hypothetical protein ACP5UT_18725, partial [Bryobacteraceae bacterium]